MILTSSPFQIASDLVQNNGHFFIKNSGQQQEVYTTTDDDGDGVSGGNDDDGDGGDGDIGDTSNDDTTSSDAGNSNIQTLSENSREVQQLPDFDLSKVPVKDESSLTHEISNTAKFTSRRDISNIATATAR